MSLLPFARHHFLDDPFFFHRLDFFDPWYDIDLFPLFPPILPRFRRIKQQERSTYSSSIKTTTDQNLELPSQPSQPEKFRVQLNIAGFNPDKIKKTIQGRKLIVESKQEERRGDRDYTIRELRESHELPEHADTNRMTSHVTSNNMLVIEIPIQNSANERRFEQTKNRHQSLTQSGRHQDRLFNDSDFFGDSDIKPRITDRGNNQKQMEMSVEMQKFRPEEINVSIKNNELIIQGEHRQEDENRSERSYFYKSTTLPPGIQVDQLESRFNENGQLKIQAPFV